MKNSNNVNPNNSTTGLLIRGSDENLTKINDFIKENNLNVYVSGKEPQHMNKVLNKKFNMSFINFNSLLDNVSVKKKVVLLKMVLKVMGILIYKQDNSIQFGLSDTSVYSNYQETLLNSVEEVSSAERVSV